MSELTRQIPATVEVCDGEQASHSLIVKLVGLTTEEEAVISGAWARGDTELILAQRNDTSENRCWFWRPRYLRSGSL